MHPLFKITFWAITAFAILSLVTFMLSAASYLLNAGALLVTVAFILLTIQTNFFLDIKIKNKTNDKN